MKDIKQLTTDELKLELKRVSMKLLITRPLSRELAKQCAEIELELELRRKEEN